MSSITMALIPPRSRSFPVVALRTCSLVALVLGAAIPGAGPVAAGAQQQAGAAESAPKPAFALARWRDAAGRHWQEIDLAELARLPQFLAVIG